MLDRDDDTTIGRGGWALVLASGLLSFVVLRQVFRYLLFPSVAFALAIALVVLLLLYRLALVVKRHDDAESGRHVRRIVPASSLAEGTPRVSGIEGAQASAVVAVPMRPDPATPLPQRPSAMVTPLAKVEAAPLILPQVAAPTAAPAAGTTPPAPIHPVSAPHPQADAPVLPEVAAPQPAVGAVPEVNAEAGPTGRSGARAAGKPGTRSGAGGKSAAKSAKNGAEAGPATARPAVGFKGKAELEARAAEQAVAAASDGASKARTGTRTRSATRPEAAKAPATGLVRLAAPRDGKADDLKLIDGVGPALERLMNNLGFYHFDQIAAWTEADVALVDAEMKSFKGRATRDKWVLQAKILAKGGTAEEAAAAAKR